MAPITEAVEVLARGPDDAYLGRHLDDTVEKKIDVRRRAAQVGRMEL